jgi:3-oxoacyl-[acyl-carrier protein] reductase
VSLLARDPQRLEQARLSLEGQERKHGVFSCDMGDLSAVRRLKNELLARDFDILICNSGGPSPGPLMDADTNQFLEAFSQHLLGHNLLVQALVPGMKERRWGRIINIISTSVKAPLPGLGVSNTIRGAVASWAKTLANELGPSGITVNNILPGYTETQRLDQIVSNAMARSGKSRQEVVDAFTADVPARRFARSEEVAYAVAFLASPLAGYVNGINLPVDGGRTVCL